MICPKCKTEVNGTRKRQIPDNITLFAAEDRAGNGLRELLLRSQKLAAVSHCFLVFCKASGGKAGLNCGSLLQND